jgi:DNA-binding response OmpR family regulator
MRVLIVDDDPVNLRLLASAIKDLCQPLTTGDPKAVVAMVREREPDLVLLDVMMPELDGLSVCEQIRADASIADTPIIFVTALDTIDGEVRGLELGAVDYLTKPLNLRLARLRIRNQLELRRQRNLAKAQQALLEAQKAELETSLARVRRLEGILSICMYCKRIRAENDAWQQLESYISQHSDARFSHGLCPNCARRLEAEEG